MLVGRSLARTVVTTPEGATLTPVSIGLEPVQARVLRAYRIWIEEHLRLRVERYCARCSTKVDLTVNPFYIAAACACSLRTFTGQTEGTFLRSCALPATSDLVGLDGKPAAPQVAQFTADEARLLRDYKREILQALDWREATYCEDCFKNSACDQDGATFGVSPTKIRFACRCRQMTYEGLTA